MLIATLWTLAAMAVLAAYIDGVASADIERAAAARSALERELAQRSTEATLAYLLSTGRMNHRSLMLETEQSFTDVEGNRGPDRSVGVIGLTGETYAGPGGARFSIQDENGLVSVNFPHSTNFASVLSYVGVSSSDIARIAPRVEDYVDMDDNLSLGGAEHFDYDRLTAPVPVPAGRAVPPSQAGVPPTDQDRSAAVPAGTVAGAASDLGLPGPSNWIMATPLELRRVLGVGDFITPDQWRRLLPMLSVRQTSGVNFNTMRPDVLAAVLKLDQGAIDNIVAERAERTVSSLSRVAMLTGTHVDIDPMGVKGLPSNFLRISIWHNASGSRSVVGMALTPFGDTPWRIDYRYTEPVIENESSDAGVFQAATPLLQ